MRLVLAILTAFLASVIMFPVSIFPQPGGEPTFIIYKYQHTVGRETDICHTAQRVVNCHAHFQLDFTGSSISLEADLTVNRFFRPVKYTAKGQNSTRSFIDVAIKIDGDKAEIRDARNNRTEQLPARFFTIEEDLPALSQEALLRYWLRNDRPRRIALLPQGEATIRQRGIDNIGGEILTRFTLHGITWGNETVWLNRLQEVAAIIGSDAEEDRVEIIRQRYVSKLSSFVARAGADAVEDLRSATATLRPVAGGTFALTGVTIIDPASDGLPKPNQTILISNGIIRAVGSNLSIPKSARIMRSDGKFVLPGLWDTHAHIEQWEWLPAFLASGITSVRDVGSEIELLVPLRRSVVSGKALGPRIIAAGLIDSDPGSLTSEHAETPERAREIVHRYHELGYDEIKIYQSLRPELIPIVTAEAHRFGMKVTGHIPTGVDALTGVRDGMDMINHISFVTRVMRPPGATGVHRDSPEAQTAIRAFLDHGTVVEPTLARSEFNLHSRQGPFSENEPSLPCWPPELAVILNNAGTAPELQPRAVAAMQTALDTTKILFDAGVPLLAGSDQVVPGSSLHRELELMVRAGLTPADAIRTAITNPVRNFGITDSGSIEVGKRADLVVLDASPLVDISNIRRVHWTVSSGKVFEADRLWQLVDVRRDTSEGCRTHE